MKHMKNTTALVKKILEEVPETRSNDMLLYYRVCAAKNSISLGLPFGTVIMSLKDYNLPSFKSVERSRRKVQEEYPELAANKDVEQFRKEQEQKYKQYAKAVNV